ncbi:prion-inhibition and propagation-domain-containing protein, partial [Neohortaea acidophila]
PADHPDYEALLTGVIVLASLFSNCVEAFNLIHPSQRWDKQEQLLITALGLQQARLLIWGDTVGISSPPPTVTDRAIPKHPSAAYPDLNEPTFFSARDPALDQPDTRQKVDEALSALVERSAHTSREEMMELYGLRPPKRFTVEYQPALDGNRLESFRERHELLKEVAESYAHLNTRRNSSIVASTWAVSDYAKFADFIKLTQEKVDYLIELTDSQERVDRAMCMDIRALGWHLSADRARVAHDRSKLILVLEYSRQEYPQYVDAVNIALRNIERERQENA